MKAMIEYKLCTFLTSEGIKVVQAYRAGSLVGDIREFYNGWTVVENHWPSSLGIAKIQYEMQQFAYQWSELEEGTEIEPFPVKFFAKD